ncbi:MAG: DUF4202 domain-containing protein [Nannocystaceae bacterium]|nr:DUF4202 domain-containing protein [Nannocystaceae bacterium]
MNEPPAKDEASARFKAARLAFDAVHRADPAGQALAYHAALARWVGQLSAENSQEGSLESSEEASLEVRLAAMAQHIERWTIPRANHPLGRAGYRRWRSELSQMHARRSTEILTDAGYDSGTTRRVAALITKQRFRTDADAGLLQDAVCLCFLELGLHEFAADRSRDQVVAILAKTWGKMTARGQDAARGLAATLPAAAQSLISDALANEA